MFGHNIMGGSASIEMRIYHSTSQPIKRGWQHAKETFVKCGAPVAGMSPRRTRRIKPNVIYCFFGRAPRKFETPQALIFSFGPAEVQSFGASFGQIPYRFEHDKVIGAKLLQPFIRSAKFVDRMPTQLKKYGGCNGAFLAFDENNKAKTRAN
jgi:hypothetical protein